MSTSAQNRRSSSSGSRGSLSSTVVCQSPVVFVLTRKVTVRDASELQATISGLRRRSSKATLPTPRRSNSATTRCPPARAFWALVGMRDRYRCCGRTGGCSRRNGDELGRTTAGTRRPPPLAANAPLGDGPVIVVLPKGSPMRHTTAAAPAVAALVGLALVVLPATATAVVPRGGHYAQSNDNVIVATFDVVGGEVRDFHHSDTCATYNVPVPVMKVRSSGKFSFSGTAIQNAIDQEFTVNVRGRTVSRT